MRTQQKLHDQSPLRKSPRLVSCSASCSAQLKPKPKPTAKIRPEDAWALSLHVVEPTPLEICPLSHEEDKSTRRSSRFTTNKYKTPSPKISRSRSRAKASSALVVVSQLRMSPRLPSPSSAPVLTLTDGENLGVEEARSQKRRRLEENEAGRRDGKKGKIYSNHKNLRRSSRLSGGDKNGNSSPQFLALTEPGSKSARNKGSSRLSATGGEEFENSSPQLLALPEPESKSSSQGSLSEKCLRSRTILMHVGYEKAKPGKVSPKKNGPELGINEKCLRSRVINCALIEYPEASEKRDVRTASSEKCLRSRSVLMHVGNEKAKPNNNLTKKSGGESSISEKSLRSRVINCALIESAEASEKGDVRSASIEKSLRSRTVLMHVGDEKARPDNISTKKNGGALSRSGKCLMSCVVNRALIESPEASEKRDVRSAWSEKSRTSKKQVQKESVERGVSGVRSNEKHLTSPKIETVLDELFGDSDSWNEEKCDSELSSQKCLRSRKIQVKVGTDEIAENSNAKNTVKSEKKEKSSVSFVGEPIPEEEAQKRWEWRYELKNKKKRKGWKINAGEEDEIILNVDCHYARAKVGNCILNIGDCVYVKGEGKKKHVGKILEFFKTMEGEDYFRVQWFFRAEDTVLKDAALLHDERRLFYSTLMNDNLLECVISKVNIVKIPPMLCLKSNPIQSAAFYYDMEYCMEYSTFRTLATETSTDKESILLNSKHPDEKPVSLTPLEILANYESSKQELSLLDLYAGCGGMSTGLCLGAKLSNMNLVTKWAVDCNSSACDSLKLNHPETQVRNEPADDFLELLRQWEELCKLYLSDLERTLKCELEDPPKAEDSTTQLDTEESSGEYEVSYLVDICYGDPSESGKRRVHFKVRWKGYGPDEDTWEPIEGLSNCEERIQDFVRKGFESKLLPLPGDVDVICGGPPCQGISGYNRYRNFESPLDDERNRQIIVFMDIAEFLKPKYVLMENVVDIIRFDKASLARFALSRLVHMKYQAKLGTIASGCYGLPQFRLRVFIWGAHPTQTLPQFPLPSHDVVVRYWPPLEFERNIVAYDEGQPRSIEKAIILQDSISDLPAVTNEESREEMTYEKLPETEFQEYIRSSRDVMMGSVTTEKKPSVLYDHRPLRLSEDDYFRVCQIPHRKGANFRDLPGVIVGEDNVARLDPTKEPVMLPTGKPLVPDSVLSFEQGKSKRPYARVWWDETISTVVTFPHVRAQVILHPEQDRVLTIRECARLQGFPDFYRFCGTIRERYCQIGNAVSVPVAKALGYALGMAYKKAVGDEPLMILPPKFASQSASSDEMVVLGS